MATPSTVPPVEAPVTPPEVPVVTTTRVFTQDQLDAAVTKARREEKDKLYSDLERSRTNERSLNDRILTLQTQLDSAIKADTPETKKLQDQLVSLRTELETERTNRTSFETNIDKVITEKLTAQEDSFDKRLRAKDEESIAEVRKTLIDSAGGRIIPELVTGSTVAEIRASFEKAKTRFEEIAGPSTPPVTPPAVTETLPVPVTPPATVPPTDATTNDSGNWRKMSEADRKKQLETMKKTAFANAGLPMKSR